MNSYEIIIIPNFAIKLWKAQKDGKSTREAFLI